ncbi:MAG: hypothetical protein RR444_09715 [Oscillospiraceae bacterium]
MNTFYLDERGGIMATRSFDDTYTAKKADVNRLHNIINDDKKLIIKKVKGHKDVKGIAMLKMLGVVK